MAKQPEGINKPPSPSWHEEEAVIDSKSEFKNFKISLSYFPNFYSPFSKVLLTDNKSMISNGLFCLIACSFNIMTGCAANTTLDCNT